MKQGQKRRVEKILWGGGGGVSGALGLMSRTLASGLKINVFGLVEEADRAAVRDGEGDPRAVSAQKPEEGR